MIKINSIKEISKQYDYFLIDLNGIMWNFDKIEFAKTNKMNIFEHSFNTIKFLYENNKNIIFFSNLRQTAEHTRSLLIKSGLKEEWPKNIITSTQSLIDYLIENNFGNRYNYIAPGPIFDLLDKNYIVDSNNYDFTITRGFEIKNENKEYYVAKFEKAMLSKKPILFLNPNKEKKVLDVFCFDDICSKHYDNLVFFGKPFDEIYKYAFKKYNIKDKTKVLAIGDKLTTDVLGAYNSNIDSAFIINGKTRKKLSCINKETIHDKILSFCEKNKLPVPKYILDNLS